ncbi:glycosyltransferase family 2 protein [Candidatus Pelagibacter sp.]|jgi:putative glycosyltransferase|nr:glycosyltransferase family 2 protein [Candidatus Pelagibacter sp.]
MKLSIVTTLYRSTIHIEEFYERITKEACKITDDYEIIFVDDGSPDDGLEKTLNLYKKDPKVRVLELSRNFGHHKAIMTGLSHAAGNFVFLIDVDLEEKPELLSQFWNELKNRSDLEVIYGVQERRKGRWFERIIGGLSWKIINFLSPINIPINTVTVRIMSKLYIESLVKYHESEIFIAGLWADVGFRQKGLKVEKLSISTSSYTNKKRLSMLLDSITSFSSKPLVYIFNIGLLITCISSLFVIKILFDKLFHNISLAGWSSLILSIWFFGGLIILFLGVIGIYLSRIFLEVKNRPNTTIKKYHQH